MNRRQFFIALAVLVILAAAGAAVVLSDRSAWTAADSRAGQKAIAGLRLSEGAEIAILDTGCASAAASRPRPIASRRFS